MRWLCFTQFMINLRCRRKVSLFDCIQTIKSESIYLNYSSSTSFVGSGLKLKDGDLCEIDIWTVIEWSIVHHCDSYCQLNINNIHAAHHSSWYIGLNFRHFPITSRKECGQMGYPHRSCRSNKFQYPVHRSTPVFSRFLCPSDSFHLPSNIISSSVSWSH